jgi:protein-disulfide isomerase
MRVGLHHATRLTAGLGIVIASLSLGACSGGGPSLPSMSQINAPSAPSAAGAPPEGSLSPEEVAASAPVTPFNPFADMTAQTGGGREVIAEPTAAEILAPGPLPDIALGRVDAPVTVVQYASLTCPFCKQFHNDVFPTFKAEYIDTGKVRYILRDFPIGRTSGQASIAMRCAKPEKALELYGKFLNQQSNWVSQEIRLDPLFAVASQVGMTRSEFDACRNDPVLVEALKSTKDRGRKLGIIGTPNFFIGTKRFKKTLVMTDLRAEIDPLLAGGPIAANAKTP